jgi:uncharacterized protein YidB (DUF937 family)
MGLFDQIVGGLMGNSGGSSALQGLLMNMLGGNQQGQTNQGETNQGQTNQGQAGQNLPAGGIGGLLATLEQAGLGQAVQSWIGTGNNQPVSPDQLHSALGEEQVQSMASHSGMSTRDLLLQLSQHLPAIIDSLTPHGQLPPQVAEQKSNAT